MLVPFRLAPSPARRFLRPDAAKFAPPLLLLLLLALPHGFAQESPSAAQSASPTRIFIKILEGEGALNNIRDRTAREPIIQIEDVNHQPVRGVRVRFNAQAGSSGAGGTFNALASYETVTDSEGKAIGRGFHPNSKTGRYTVEVVAVVGTTIATALIYEDNGAGGIASQLKTMFKSKIFIASAGTAAAAGGTVAALDQNRTSTSTQVALVPEIDPSFALAVVVLLAGSIVALRGRS